MIEKAIQAHRTGIISLEELFITLARKSSEDNWCRIFGSLPQDEQDSFWKWAIPLLMGQTTLVLSTGFPAVDDSELETLRARAREAGWDLSSSDKEDEQGNKRGHSDFS